MAKENLKRIKSHYIEYKNILNLNRQYSLTLLTDDGERTIFPFWIGHFEILHGAKIVIDGDSDMEFEL